MGSSSSRPSGSVTTVQSNEPSDFIKPYLTEGLDTAQDLFGTPRTMYEGSTVVPFSPVTEAGLTAIQTRAEAGSPLVTGAQDLTAATMRGDYLSPDSNPYLASAMDAATRPMREAFTQDVMPGIDPFGVSTSMDNRGPASIPGPNVIDDIGDIDPASYDPFGDIADALIGDMFGGGEDAPGGYNDPGGYGDMGGFT